MATTSTPIYFRHPAPRPYQKQLMDDIFSAISQGNNFMAHAPTGSGKTDAAIAAALSHAIENNLTVFFLTPKISQHKIAMDVVNGIAAKHAVKVRAVDMVGRLHCCIDRSLQELDNESFQTTCERKRQKQQCEYFINARGHGRAAEAKADIRFNKMLNDYGSGKGHHDLVKLGAACASCPYEWSLKLAALSNVVVADYYHLLVPHVRDIFLTKIKKRIEDSIIIVDEAHNLASRIRSSLSRSVNTFTFTRVAREMQLIGLDAGPIEDEFSKWSKGMLGPQRERVVHCADFNAFLGVFGLGIDEIIAKLEDTGYAIVEKTGKKSACLRMSRFLNEWNDDPQDDYSVRILKAHGEHFYLSRRLLDPSSATSVLNQCASSVLMSGTLLPLEMHRDILGLDPKRTVMKSYPSPFDRSSVVNVVTENITTRYSKRDDEGYETIAKNLDAIIAKTPGGTAIFFPSYKVLDHVMPRVLSRNLHVQKPSMKPSEVRKMLRDFKGGGVLCGVQGGSLSEGVDYCEGEIKTVVIVGVALEEMGLETRALIDYYDEKFGRGWDYGYLYPGTIKALQAAGRARRKESDRVAVVYMDERFKWGKYNWILNKNERIVVTDKPETFVEEFHAIHNKIRAEKA